MKIFTFLCLVLLGAPLWAAPAKQQSPTVNIGVGRDVAPGKRVQVTINTRNLPAVNVAAWRLSDFSWLLNRERNTRPRPRTPGKADVFFKASVVDPKAKPNAYQIDVYRSRQINLPITRPGVYLVEASGGGASDWGVVNVTNLAVVAKRSPRHLLAWVTDFRSGKVIPGASAALWNRGGSAQGNAQKTGADGATLFETSGGKDQVLVVTRGDDAAGVTVSNPEPDGQLRMHFQTDRPIYRPGHTVFWKAILRRTQSNGWTPVANVSCQVEVRDSKDIVLFQQTLKTNARGTLDGKVELPSEGSLGQYSVVIKLSPRETQYGSFTVAAYRKPEYEVKIAPEKSRYLSGETLKFKLGATYFFGAPVPKATVHYTVRRAALPLQFQDEDGDVSYFYGGDGNLYDRDSYGQSDVVADSSADLDDKGEVSIEVPTPRDGQDATYSISATVTDGSRRQMDGSASVPVFRAAKRIAVRGEVSYVPVGYLMPLQIRVADLDGKPVAGRVKLELQRAVWQPKERRYRYENITSTSLEVPASGKASATLPAQTEGTLRVRASMPDGTGREALTTWDFWVAGPRATWQEEDNSPRIAVKPDKLAYKPGETMKILVSTNVATRPVLATIEGLDVWNYAVIPAGKPSYVWNVLARVTLSPNAFAAAAQWTPNGLISDNKILPIPDPSRRLQVELQSDKAVYAPGETAKYTLITRDDKGNPIAAEVAVAVIDGALLSVRPDNTPALYETFWANRSNFVSTSSSAPEEVSGGAYQRVGKTASVRTQFKDTAFWNARIETGADGRATFTLPVPGNLTMWRATARAITADTRVGEAQSSMLSTRPVTLRLATPRQLVVGDALDLIVSVNNRTDKAHQMETALAGKDVLVEGAKVKTLDVPAKGEAKTTFPIRANALPENGESVLTGRTLAADATKENAVDLSDALESRVPIVPNGIARRVVQGGTFSDKETAQIALPDDRIEPATTAKLTIARGIGEVAATLGAQILDGDRESAPDAATRLLAIALLKPKGWEREATENIAMLGRYQTGQGGWNWWEDQQPDTRVTALITTNLDRAGALGVTIPDALRQRGIAGATNLYNRGSLWEERALLASALALNKTDGAQTRLEEVDRRAETLSPFARLTLAEAFASVNDEKRARQILDDVLKNANIGTDVASIPVGQRDGWENGAADATAAALSLMIQLEVNPKLQAKFARFLANGGNIGYASRTSQNHRLRALWKYDQKHPGAREIGTLRVALNGKNVEVPAAVSYKPLEIPLPRALWKDGANVLNIERDGAGELFWNLEARVYQPASAEVGKNVRVFRRYEAQNAALTWREVDGPVKVGTAIRCTVVVWPDDRADALKVVEPIPAGFEYVDSDGDYGQSGQSEVRDGAVVHYLHGHGLPVTFRYYLRSETTGRMTALPALAEVVQRPDARGNSDAMKFVVEEK